jgi:hypothetical protein
MLKKSMISMLLLALSLVVWAKGTMTWDFEKTPTGSIPAGWQVQTTNPTNGDAVWKVVQDKTAPSGKHALVLVDPKGHHGSTFNLCWTDKVKFKDGRIKVRFKANTGREDQGGGVIWRARDKDNYYIARFNPLEDNFRLYYVKNGHRRMLATARVHLTSGKWHSMEIVQDGNHYQAFLNGKKYLDGRDDTFKLAGGVGLWTKADAATSFDDFIVILK